MGLCHHGGFGSTPRLPVVALCLFAIVTPVVCTNYLLYSVNPAEGFNFRREVYMRAAVFVNNLGPDWTLVLPPWPFLPHWDKNIDQNNLKWSKFFNLTALNEYVPVLEFEDYLKRERNIQKVIYLLKNSQTDLLNFGDLLLSEKSYINSVLCQKTFKYTRLTDAQHWWGYVYGEEYDMDVMSISCLQLAKGQTIGYDDLKNIMGQAKSVMIERFENVNGYTWQLRIESTLARKSMVYAEHLKKVGNKFINDSLGGPNTYISVHWRRGDYTYNRPYLIPSPKTVAEQITNFTETHGLMKCKVFLATDAARHEKQKLKMLMNNSLIWYEPTIEELTQYGSGGVAIIDQWIASHAKYFFGVQKSYFSQSIRDDRRLMGISSSTVFELCGPIAGCTEHRPNSNYSSEQPHYHDEV